MFKVSVDVKNDKKLLLALSNFRGHMENLKPVWDDVQAEFYKIETQLFDTQGASGASGKWKPLSIPYRKYKIEKYGFAEPILHRTYALRATLTQNVQSVSIVRKKKQEMEIGTSLPRAARQYKAGRKAIDLDQSDRKRLVATVGNKLLEIARKEGFN